MTLAPLVTAALTASAGGLTERVSHTYEQHLAASPERVLPLLTPMGERAWAAGWQPEMRWEPPGGGAGTLFVTRHPGQPDTMWLLDTWAPAAGHVHYVHVTPGSDVTEVDIQLEPEGRDGSIARVRYTWTALGAAGVALIRSKTPEAYAQFMHHWEAELNHYLTSGRMLPPAGN